MNRRIPGRRAYAHASGFTLIELIITMLVASILMAIAIPAFNNFVLNDRDIGQANSLVSSLNYARAEAIKRNVPGGITVCPSVDGQTCSGANWAGGWVVTDQVPGDAPLQSIPALAGSNTLTPVGATTGVTFTSTGLVNGALTIRICDTRGAASARDVEVNATGRIAGSQIPGQSVSGVALTCP
jgi:type IV fimbrial biogenesis protein FimT